MVAQGKGFGGGGDFGRATPAAASGNAASRAQANLRSGAFATQAPGTQYQIPVRMGSYQSPVNRGQFDDNLRTTGPKVTQNKDWGNRFDLTDEGVQAAMGAWYQFDDKERTALTHRMWYLGLIKDVNDFDSAYSVWQKAVTHAGRFAMTGKEIDPRDVLDLLGDASGKSAVGGKYNRDGKKIQRTIDLTDPETAKAWISQAFQQSMGRAPEDAEIRAMTDALNAKQRATPTVVTTTPTQWDEQGNAIDATTTKEGGVDSQAYLANQINADPEATAHQAAGELYPALLAALGGGLS